MTLKATVKQIYYDGNKPKRIILESTSGKRIDSIIKGDFITEVIDLIKLVNVPILVDPEKPYINTDILVYDEKTGKITVEKPVPPKPEPEEEPIPIKE